MDKRLIGIFADMDNYRDECISSIERAGENLIKASRALVNMDRMAQKAYEYLQQEKEQSS